MKKNLLMIALIALMGAGNISAALITIKNLKSNQEVEKLFVDDETSIGNLRADMQGLLSEQVSPVSSNFENGLGEAVFTAISKGKSDHTLLKDSFKIGSDMTLYIWENQKSFEDWVAAQKAPQEKKEELKEAEKVAYDITVVMKKDPSRREKYSMTESQKEELGEHYSVKNFKEFVATNAFNIPAEQYESLKVVLNGKELSDNELLFEKIGLGSTTLYLEDKQPTGKKEEEKKKAAYTLKIVRKNVPSEGESQAIELTNEEGNPLEGDILELNILELKQYIARHQNKYFGIPVEQQKLLFEDQGHLVELKNEEKLSDFRSGKTFYLEVVEKKGAEKKAPAQVEQKESPQKQPAPSKSTLKKPISKMTSREIGQLKYNDLSQKDQEEIFTMALLSGLEANRNAARKVVEQNGKTDWAKAMVDLKRDIREEFTKLMKPMASSSEGQSEESAKKSPVKLLDKMSSKEIGALKYENLSPEQQEQLFEMALFSGLESNRSAARKVIDIYRTSKGMDKLQWDRQLSDILAG